MAREITARDDVRRVLEEARTVVVLGAHPEGFRPAHYVPAYLQAQGYRLALVNPRYAGQSVLGEPVHASLADLAGQAFDVVDVFRRAEDLPGHLEEILAMAPSPKLVWLQLGIRNDAFAQALVQAGIDVIQDRCMLADHRSMGLTRA